MASTSFAYAGDEDYRKNDPVAGHSTAGAFDAQVSRSIAVANNLRAGASFVRVEGDALEDERVVVLREKPLGFVRVDRVEV